MIFRPISRGRWRKLLLQLVINGLLQALLTICLAVLIRISFDSLISGINKTISNHVILLCGGFVVIAASTAWLRMRERLDSERLGQDYIHRIRMDLFNHLTRLTPRSLQTSSRGSIMLRFIGDLNALKRWISLGFARITVAGVIVLGTLGTLFFLNWLIALGVVVIITVGICTLLLAGKHIQETVKEGRKRRSYLAANVNEKIVTMAVVQVFGQSRRERKRVRRQSDRLRKAMIAKAQKIGLIRAIVHTTAILATAVVLLLGGYEIAAERTSPGSIVAILTIVGLLIPSLKGLGRVYEYWHDAKISSQKIQKFLQTPTQVKEIVNAPDLQNGRGSLEFTEIALKDILSSITITAAPGQLVGIVGPNGAGKSSLLMLAARLQDPDEGSVSINGQDLATHSLASVRRAIGIVSPDLPLLRGKIDKNLRYRCPNAPDQEIRRITILCEIDALLENTPAGLQTRLSEGGINLSLGQRRRIELARALVGNPEILLLDEADTNLDQNSGKLLDKILANYQGTVLMVSHNRQRLAKADVIWHMENGKIIKVETPKNPLPNLPANLPVKQGGLAHNDPAVPEIERK